jgi:hypothetical protein
MRRVVEHEPGLALNAGRLLSEAKKAAVCMVARIRAQLKATEMLGSMATALPRLKSS